MAVTKQTYTITPTWTAANLADIYRSAFIDAGLMTDWHDSFLSGSVENRVLRVQYDATKTYGTTFYWFMFTTTGAFVHVATGWNTTTKVPTGTQYLDFFSTATNTTSNHWQFSGTLTVNTETSLVRYSSGTRHWFISQQGGTRQCFSIQPASHGVQPWLNLDRGYYSGLAFVNPSVSLQSCAAVRFTRGPALRRDLTIGTALVGDTTANSYGINQNTICLISYAAPGNVSNNANANWRVMFGLDNSFNQGFFMSSVILPTGFTGTNPAYSSNSSPVFHSLQITPYSTTALNSDFGITFHYATNVFGFQDKFIVTPGVEEWEVLSFANAGLGNGTAPSAAFLARVV
jgi:hypothetical protein